jgi:hypothetical protein
MQAKAAHMPHLRFHGTQYDIDEIVDKYFHEFAFLPRTNEPALFPDINPTDMTGSMAGWLFIKTDRKLYDLAVFMTLQAVYKGTGKPFSSDSTFDPNMVDISTYCLHELWHIPLGSYDMPQMETIQLVAANHIKAAAKELPWLPLPDPADIVEDETRIGHLTIYGKANVWDLRHIADMIEKWELFSPADGMYLWQPSWVFTKS